MGFWDGAVHSGPHRKNGVDNSAIDAQRASGVVRVENRQ